MTCSGALYDGKHATITDEVTWQQCQQVMSTLRIGGDRSWKRTHYLKTSLRCGQCGSRIGYGPVKGHGGNYE